MNTVILRPHFSVILRPHFSVILRPKAEGSYDWKEGWDSSLRSE